MVEMVVSSLIWVQIQVGQWQQSFAVVFKGRLN